MLHRTACALIQGLIDQWIDSCARSLDAPAAALSSGGDAGAASTAIESFLKECDAALINSPNLVGSAFTIADAAVLGGMGALKAPGLMPVDAQRFPNVALWLSPL